MPRFYDEANPALNSFRRINAEVVKRRKKKYQGETAATPVVSGAAAQFDNLRQRLVAMQVGLTDLSQTIGLSASARSPATVIDRFVSTASNLSGQVSNTRDFFVRQMKRSVNGFSSDEVAEILELTRSLNRDLMSSLTTLEDRAENPRGRQASRDFASSSLNVLETFARSLNELLNMIADAVASYKQSGVGAGRKRIIKCGGDHTIGHSIRQMINANPYPRLNEPIRTIPRITMPVRPISIREIPDARFFRKIGGAELYSQEPVLKGGTAVASRVGLQFGNPFTGLGPFPPRNTQDLKDLPRRFL